MTNPDLADDHDDLDPSNALPSERRFLEYALTRYTDRYVYWPEDYGLPQLEEAQSMKALISSAKVPASPGPYSPGLTVGEWIFLSGQGGFDPNTGKVVSDDLVEQTEQTFDNIETLLEAAGASLDDVVSCLVHLVDLADFPAFNAVYERKFTDVKPVRTTVRADLVAGLLVEITVVARARNTGVVYNINYISNIELASLSRHS